AILRTQLCRPADLLHQPLDQPDSMSRGLAILGESDAIINKEDRAFIGRFIREQRDRYRPASGRERVEIAVRDQFSDDETKGRYAIEVEDHRCRVPNAPDAAVLFMLQRFEAGTE